MKGGFLLKYMLMDGRFEPLQADLASRSCIQIMLNTVSNTEHVPKTERHIQMTKEWTHCVHNMLPFKKMPAHMIIDMVYWGTFWLNSFPPNDGVSKTISPRAIMAGLQIDYAQHCKLEFGSYVQTHKDHDNSMATWGTGAIALRPTSNKQGGYYFMSLTTGQQINRN
jgi:hypothetical protein